ncbi:hypothetical protein B0H17DRAFT_1091963 [Mycena rosella]|uniref:histidine kinase n=1 Tax=Mycena rosella TaxID=1033263 RepID=A0AAD7CUH1_MYCRO|nr:hypothetical protein B0H17DRAFT_1091963 [Mycena rosella]
MGGSYDPSAEEDPALAKWTHFLQEYAKGNEQPPPPLLRSTRPKPSQLPSFEVPLYPPGAISPETAQTIAEFYDEHGFLPPPRADEETVRLQTINEYNLFREDQAENFHRSTSVVNTFFDFAPICTISLFHNDVQVVVSKAGDFPVELGEGLVTETSICGHAVLKKNGETTELNELAGDWRFAGNPWSLTSNGVKGYVGVPITLEVDPANPLDSERVTVGVMALMSNRPFPKLTAIQLKVLSDLCMMLSVQLRSTWEGWRRGKEARLRNAVTLFLETALVDPSQRAIVHTGAIVEPPVEGSRSGTNTPRTAEPMSFSSNLFANAAEQIQQLVEADFTVIIDLSSFRATKTHGRQPNGRSNSWTTDGRHLQSKAQLSKWVLGSSSSPAYKGHETKFDTPEATAAIGSFLDMYFVTRRSVFSGSGTLSGFEGLLSVSQDSPSAPTERGSTVSGSVAHLVVPFFSANRPNLLIVVASTSPIFSPSPSDVNVTFVSNVGAVLVAHLAQSVIVEADAAKTAFVSSISHELRTPLHGLLGQIDLLRDSFSSGELSNVPILLDSAEYCGTALRDIIDDVLDFGKMAKASHDGADNSARSRNALVDLAEITLQTSRTCWARQLQRQSQYGSAESAEFSSIELVVEFEDRSMFSNWRMALDVSGFIRILNNLITNSLKYTAEGVVTVSLTSGNGQDENGKDEKQVTLRVEDTGRGIAPEFLDRLYEPFTQADSFSSGAGLGLHITKSVVDRMQGTIAVESQPGVGSVFTVVFPVPNIEVAPTGTRPKMQRQQVSLLPTPTSPVLNDTSRSPAPALPPSGESKANGAEEGQLLVGATERLTLQPTPVALTKSKPEEAGEDEHLKILVVDDNAISRKILVTMLKRLNATAHQADDGLTALDVFREVHPHVVWTDVSMPRMDGVTSAKEMRRIEREKGWPPSHIVAITGLGLSDEHIRREALLGPAALDGWLIKGQTNLNSLKESLIAVRRKLRSNPVPGQR